MLLRGTGGIVGSASDATTVEVRDGKLTFHGPHGSVSSGRQYDEDTAFALARDLLRGEPRRCVWCEAPLAGSLAQKFCSDKHRVYWNRGLKKLSKDEQDSARLYARLLSRKF